MLWMSSTVQRRSSELRSSCGVVGPSRCSFAVCSSARTTAMYSRYTGISRMPGVQGEAEDREDHHHADEGGAALARTHSELPKVKVAIFTARLSVITRVRRPADSPHSLRRGCHFYAGSMDRVADAAPDRRVRQSQFSQMRTALPTRLRSGTKPTSGKRLSRLLSRLSPMKK